MNTSTLKTSKHSKIISGTTKFISRGSSVLPSFNDLISNLLCRNLTLIGRPFDLPYKIYLSTSLTLISDLRKCATMSPRTLFAILLLLPVVGCGRPRSEIDTLFSRTTLATASKEVYLLKDFTVISLPLYINSIESQIDSIHYRLTSMRYASDIEFSEPMIVTAKTTQTSNSGTKKIPVTMTLFGRLMTVHDGATICSKLGLD